MRFYLDYSAQYFSATDPRTLFDDCTSHKNLGTPYWVVSLTNSAVSDPNWEVTPIYWPRNSKATHFPEHLYRYFVHLEHDIVCDFLERLFFAIPQDIVADLAAVS